MWAILAAEYPSRPPSSQPDSILMRQSKTNTLPDENLATELLTPLLVATAMLSATAFGLLLIWQWRDGVWPYVLAGVLMFSVWAASWARQQQRLRLSGAILAHTFAILPILSVSSFRLDGNVIIFLAPLGVILAALLVSAQAAFRVAWTALFVLMVTALLFEPNLRLTTVTLLVMGFLMLGTAVLSWLAAYTIQGTIAWSLETSAKSERRETLLWQTQAELEQALRERDRLNDELHTANRNLEAARAAAEAAYRSKASFMATMSHELRTPLNLIIGFSTAMIEHPEMYDDQPLPETYRSDIIEIQRSGQHLLGLINDILDLAKVEAGRLELNRVSLALTPLLDEVQKTAQVLLKDRPVVLRREVAGMLPPVLADEVRVRQVLLNLLSNACKFTRQGEIVLGARTEGEQVVLWVRDTGIGIAAEDQARIFNEFEQVESHDAKTQSGTGLGLAICRWLVELHGGRMWLESELGKGSSFYFSLPRLNVTSPDRHAVNIETKVVT